MRRPRTLSLLAGLVFALHPAHVEAVVTLYGRTEPLSACFALGALLLALKSRGRWSWLLAAVLILAAGILSKEMAVMVPALFLLVAAALPAAAGLEERPGLRTPAARRALLRALATAAALSLAFLPYLAGHGTSLAVAPVARWFPVGTPPWHIALTMSRVLGEYLRILVFPSFLGGDFAYAARIPTLAAPTPGFAAATLAWAFALAAGIVLLRRAPLPGIGITWVFVALLPVLQIIPVGVLIAERLLYLPSAGFSMTAAWALAKVLPERAGPDQRSTPEHLPRLARSAGVGLVLVALCARTVVRTRDWTSDPRFWRSELAKAPHEVVVNNNLALAYLARGEPAKAVPRLETALAVNPGYWRAWVNIGIAWGQLRERSASLHAFQEAARLAPDESDPAALPRTHPPRGGRRPGRHPRAPRGAPQGARAGGAGARAGRVAPRGWPRRPGPRGAPGRGPARPGRRGLAEEARRAGPLRNDPPELPAGRGPPRKDSSGGSARMCARWCAPAFALTRSDPAPAPSPSPRRAFPCPCAYNVCPWPRNPAPGAIRLSSSRRRNRTGRPSVPRSTRCCSTTTTTPPGVRGAGPDRSVQPRP